MTHVADCLRDRGEWDWTVLRSLCLREAERVLGCCETAEDAAQEAVVRGRYWHDLSDSDLARQLDVAEVTVRVRLHRLRSRLRDALLET